MGKLVEEWRDIQGYEGLYQVSDWGNVKSVERYVRNGNGFRKVRERILKTFLAGDEKEYHYVKLYKNNDRKPFTIHELVAMAFIPNPYNKPEIDHIDTNKKNNNVENLRWVTHSENMNNPITIEKLECNSNSKHVYQYDLEGNLIGVYVSLHEAERHGYGRKEITNCCNGKQKKHKGSQWSFTPL